MFKLQFRKKGLIALLTLFLLTLCVGIFAVLSVNSEISVAADNEYESVSIEDKTITFVYGETYTINSQTYKIGDGTLVPNVALYYFTQQEGWQFGINWGVDLTKFTFIDGTEMTASQNNPHEGYYFNTIAEYVSLSGTYSVNVKSGEDEGLTNEDYTIVVLPRTIEINGVDDVPEFLIANSVSGSVSEGSALYGDHTTIYKNNVGWYSQLSQDEDAVNVKTVTNSYVYVDSNETSVMIKGETFEADTTKSTLALGNSTLTVSSRKGVTYTSSGEYVATFAINVSDKLNNVFHFAEDAVLSDSYKGLEIKNITQNTFTLTKHWFILDKGGIIVQSGSSSAEPYAPIKVAGKATFELNYNDAFELVQPGVIDQSADQNSLIQGLSSEFSISYLPEGASKAVVIAPRTDLQNGGSVNEHYLAYYINSSMPVGTYTLTVYSHYTAQIQNRATPKDIKGEYTFKVLPMTLGADSTSAVNNVKSALNTTHRYPFTYPVNKIHTDDLKSSALIALFNTHRQKGGESNNYWVTSDADKYFASGLTLRYCLEDQSEYVTEDTVKKSLGKDGTYKFYYSISALNYVTLGGADDINYSDYSFTTELYTSTNGWDSVPVMEGWSYGMFDVNFNVIKGTLKNSTGVTAYYRIGTKTRLDGWLEDGDYYWLDVSNGTSVKGGSSDKAYFTVGSDGKVGDTVKALLAKLDAGTYVLGSYVTGSGTVAAFETIVCSSFTVKKLENFWTTHPRLSNWTYGAFDETNDFVAGVDALEGEITYTLKGNGKDLTFYSNGDSLTYYDESSLTTFNIEFELNTYSVGSYTFTAYRNGDGKNYSDLRYEQTVVISKATNSWTTEAMISSWAYGSFTSNMFRAAVSRFDMNEIRYTVQKVNNSNGLDEMSDWSHLTSDEFKGKLNTLGVGNYNLNVSVPGGTNYDGIKQDLRFSVLLVDYVWDVTPSAAANWTWGDINTPAGLAQHSDLQSILYPTIRNALADYSIKYTITGTGEYKEITVAVPYANPSSRNVDDLVEEFRSLVDVNSNYRVTIEVLGGENYNSLIYPVNIRVTQATNEFNPATFETSFSADYDKKTDIKIPEIKAKYGEVKFYNDRDLNSVIEDVDDWLSKCKAGTFTIYVGVKAEAGKFTGLWREISIDIIGVPGTWENASYLKPTYTFDFADYRNNLRSMIDNVTLPEGNPENGTTSYTVGFTSHNNTFNYNEISKDSVAEVKLWVEDYCKYAGTITIKASYQPNDPGFTRLDYTVTITVNPIKLKLAKEYGETINGSFGNVGVHDPEFSNASVDYDVSSMVSFTITDPNNGAVENSSGLSLSELFNTLKAYDTSGAYYSVVITYQGNDIYVGGSISFRVHIAKAQNSWTEQTTALGTAISRSYGSDLSDLVFIPTHGDAGAVAVTIDGNTVTDISAHVLANGAKTYVIKATLAAGDEYAELNYTITLTITTAENKWASDDDKPHFIGVDPKYTQTGTTYYSWEYGTSVAWAANAQFGDVTVEYYKYVPDNLARSKGQKLDGMPADVGDYVAVFRVDSPSTGGYKELYAELIFYITQKDLQEWTSSPYVAGWIWSAYNTESNKFTAIPETGGEISFEIYDSNGVKKIARFTVNANGVPVDYYNSLDGEAAQGGILAELKNLIEGEYTLWTYVGATQNYQAFIDKGTRFNVTLAQNSWIITPQIAAWSKSDYNAEKNAPQAKTYYGVAEITVTMNSTSTVLYQATYNAIYDKSNPTYVEGITAEGFDDNGYKVIKDELATAEAGFWYTLTVTVAGLDKCYSSLGENTLTFMVFDEGTSSNFWTNNPAIKGWVAGFDEKGNGIFELPTASAFRGEIYFEFYKDGDPTEPAYVIVAGEDSALVSKESGYAKDFYVPTAPGRYYMYAYATTGNDESLLESSQIYFEIDYRMNFFDDTIELFADTLFLGDYYAGVEGWGVPYAEANYSATEDIEYYFFTYNEDGTINNLGATCPTRPGKYYVAAKAAARYCEDIIRTKQFEIKLSTNKWEGDTSPTIENWSEEFNSTSPDPTGSVEGGKKITYYYIDNATGEWLTEKPTKAGSYTLVARVEEEGYETLESKYEFTITPAFDETLVLICTILAFVGCAFTVVVIIFAIRRNREN